MMPGITAHMIADASSAHCHGADIDVTGVCIDSRELIPGDLFVALRGQRVDGHQFLATVSEEGAAAVMVEQHDPELSLTQIVVSDSQQGLGAIATLNRQSFNGPVIAITGSAGKTSCKNMLAAILSQKGSVCATEGNFNNEIGLPLSVLRLDKGHDYAVLEMGAARIGDIRYLTKIAQPDISVLSNVAEAHLGGFGSLDRTAQAKAEIFDALRPNGTAVLNSDDHYAPYWRKKINELTDVNLIDFSLEDAGAAIYASEIRLSVQGIDFHVDTRCLGNKESYDVCMPLLGSHNVANALAAIAAATALGIQPKAVQTGLSLVAAERGRLYARAGLNNLLVIDDSYNSNPTAAKASVQTLQALALSEAQQQQKEKPATLAVLGDMGELGCDSAALHRSVGEYAGAIGIDHLFSIGEFSQDIIEGFYSTRSSKVATDSRGFDSKSAIASRILSEGFNAAMVLIKGSRFTQMELLVNQLCGDLSAEEKGSVVQGCSDEKTPEQRGTQC